MRAVVVVSLALFVHSGTTLGVHATTTDPPEDELTATLARPSCRIFVDATAKQNRFVLIEGSPDEDAVQIFDEFPSILPGLGDMEPRETYQQLRPGFMSIAEYLQRQPADPQRVEPRYCHTHLLVTGALKSVGHDRLNDLFHQLHQDSIEDAQFPFRFARDDLRVIETAGKGYFHSLGVNYLDGRITSNLSPGAVELAGVLSLNPDGLLMSFDGQERWRRGIRRKFVSRVLNMTDFFSREYVDVTYDRFHSIMADALYDSATTKTDVVAHPCLFRGFSEQKSVGKLAAASTVQLEGAGDATACLRQMKSVIKQSNNDCPGGKFCFFNSVSQPKPTNPFFASGSFVSTVNFANEVLKRSSKKANAELLSDLPMPTLLSLKSAAEEVCQTSWETIEGLNLEYEQTFISHGCFELCHAVAVLEQLGITDEEKRVVFGEPSMNEIKVTQDSDPSPSKSVRSTPEELSWLVGAFMYLELLQKQKSYSVEADIFAVRVSEGLPMGWAMSAILLVGACVSLYFTTGARPVKTKGGGYRRVVNSSSSSSEQPRHTTCAIMFIDDASE
ncbi:hypothetical protein Poli38472_010015 [Pythium oligandrum]|uniref:Uncharacterized protein n=1 Tax=Pythium oligandrum TaxID=41045 RepID=A0A8K1FDK4_PYTOL|nr:hypothetical protein Poli38472_010015 [Pythium oligandrum]|eukprot:TMW58456.1 hypothetical protein Poli38472_010015 [Pythium oligandrum]